MSTEDKQSSFALLNEEDRGPRYDEDTRFKFTWQQIPTVDAHVDEDEWPRRQIPVLLQTLPENMVLNEHVRLILQWSLRRTAQHSVEDTEPAEAPVAKTNTIVTNEGCPNSASQFEAHDAVQRRYDGETSTISSSTKARRANPLVSRLKQLRQDVASKMASKGPVVAPSAAPSTDAAEEAHATGECISCFDDFSKADLVHLTCSHDYCKPCLHEVILTAMKTESAFPPKCCLTEIPLKTVLVCLNGKQRDEYKEKSAEYAIPAGHRWYCPEPKCARWIRPEKLHRERRSQQTCPHCKVNICSVCRSLAHDANEECPQDFGLDATLEVAEAEGWRRCYSCRTMVELTTGCRHITCRCGAEFCYVCNARWRTCSCSEADKERRLQELRTRRQEREQREHEQEERQREEDEAALAEAEEIAEAIRQVEEMEREEAIRRVEEERRKQLEEELLLAQLEEARLLEEIARREAEEEAERQLREVLLASSQEECQAMMKILMQIINFQHAALMSEHAALEQRCTHEHEARHQKALNESEEKHLWLHENIAKRTEALNDVQRQEWEQLLQQADEEEDDLFMQMTMYLRDKPNREQREKKMRDALQRQQLEKQTELQARHDEERQKLDFGIHYEFCGLQKADFVRMEPLEAQHQSTLEQLGRRVGCDRKWFQLISTRRIEMLLEHKRLILDQIKAEKEPLGLTEELANSVIPMLPLTDDCCTPSLAPYSSAGEHTQLETSSTVEIEWPPLKSHSKPTRQKVQLSVLGLAVEPVDDKFESPVSPLEPPSAQRPPTLSPAAASQASETALARSDTIVRHVPGAFPATNPSTLSNRHTYPQSAAVQQEGQPSILDRPRPRKPKRNSAAAAVSMSGVMAMSFMVETKDDPLQQPAATAPNPTERSGSVATTDSSNPSMSSITTVPSKTTYDSSRTSSRITATDAELLDSISASKVAHTWSTSMAGGKTGKRRGSIFGNLLKKKDRSEEEIKRKMSTCVGDGYGI